MAPERWLVLRVRAPSEEVAADLAEGLVALGGNAVQQEEDALITYLPADGDAEGLAEQARARLESLAGTPLEVTWRLERDEDWSAAWRRGLRPRRVGERLVVAPSWTAPRRRPGDVVVVIDPGMAFGTGEHATTRGVLRLLEACLRAGDRVLDVGTGTGILAIAAALLGAGWVLAVDRDEDAIGAARGNVARNGVEGRVSLVRAAVDAGLLDGFGPGRFDLVLANVSSHALVPLLPSLRRLLAPGGRFVAGGILEHEADAFAGAAAAAGFALRREDLEEEWWSGWFEPAAG